MLRGRRISFLLSCVFHVSWFLGLLVSQCLGFLVSWFQCFLVSISIFLDFKVSWFLSCLVSTWIDFLFFVVSWFLGFKVSKIYQITISCFLEATDPISKVFKNLWDGSSGLFGPRLFHHVQKTMSEHLILSETILSERLRVFSWIIWGVLVSPKRNIFGLGSHGHVRKSENHEMLQIFRVFPKWSLKLTSPKWSRIVLRSFWAILSIIFTMKITAEPLDPKSAFYSDFLDFP